MRILFIRHAEAVEADGFAGSDMERPLTGRGEKTFRSMARVLAAHYPRPDQVITSAAVRAHDTAQGLVKAFGGGRLRVEPALNPGAGPSAYLRALPAGGWKRDGLVVLVGHEPDLSAAVAELMGGEGVRLKMKKGACAEVEWNAPRGGELRALLDPSWARRRLTKDG